VARLGRQIKEMSTMPGVNHDTAMKLPATALPRTTCGQAPGWGLHGRRGEREMLDRLAADVRAGHSRVLVLRGEPGTGKSALLDYLARRAVGCRVARVAGAEPETEMTFAGLHQLCAPFLDRLGHLPGPQRDALRTTTSSRWRRRKRSGTSTSYSFSKPNDGARVPRPPLSPRRCKRRSRADSSVGARPTGT
jgi:AAA ATPase-like protein